MLATKLDEIVRIVQQGNWPHLSGWPLVPRERIEALLFDGDWPEGEEHDRWLETAPAEEIAAWFLEAYEPDMWDEVA